MKDSTRVIICVCTICLAVIMAAFTADSFRGTEKSPASAQEEDGGSGEIGGETGFVLRELGGKIAVYAAYDLNSPISITDIRVSALRESDRRLLASGLTAAGYGDVLRLLEDLGS